MFHRISRPLLFLTVLAAGTYAQTPPPPADPATPEQSASNPNNPSDLIDKAPPAALSKEKIPVGSKIYIAPLGGYESYLTAAIFKKGTPVVVVNNREMADYELTGVSETHQAGWVKMLLLGSQQTNEQASVVMTNLKTGVVVWGYNVNKTNSARGKQSSSEACAKHLKARIEGRE
jgi:hypothetical protein